MLAMLALCSVPLRSGTAKAAASAGLGRPQVAPITAGVASTGAG